VFKLGEDLQPPWSSPVAGDTTLQGTLKGKYHCTVDLLFDWFRKVRLCSTKFSAPSTETHF